MYGIIKIPFSKIIFVPVTEAGKKTLPTAVGICGG
jgi:hypothetical protein